jgi:pantetheine-phosphate adenylyltransferase
MPKTALFPGSFDPFTLGHEDIVRRALPLFDGLYIGIGENQDKRYQYTLEERMAMVQALYANEPKIQVVSYSGLTVHFAHTLGVQFLLRGIRNPSDFEFEKSIAQANRQMVPDLDTVFLLTTARYAYISSSIVRDVIRHGGDASVFLPDGLRLPARP